MGGARPPYRTRPAQVVAEPLLAARESSVLPQQQSPCEEVLQRGPHPVGSDGWRRRVEDDVVILVNEYRRRRGLLPLRVDERLRASSRGHSHDMAGRRFFDHLSPDGRRPVDRMLAAGYQHPAAENIARGQRTAHEVVTAWINSPAHRRNLEHADFRAIGVGVQLGALGPWWTQHFGYDE